jgi:two-component system LytT family response regulator
MIKALIVDDVDLAREAIRVRLEEETDVEIVGEARSGCEALSAIRGLEPDLLFLDIQMPGLDGFQVLESLEANQVPATIFVTAHDKYAVKAFEAHALHFLLKPIDDDQFKESLQRARRELADDQMRKDANRNVADFLASRTGPVSPHVESRPQRTALTRFAVKDADGILLVRVDEVDWVGSAGNYAELHVGERSFLIRKMLSDLEEELDPLSFARISRSTIVNIGRVQRLRTLWHGDFAVHLKDGKVLRMSRRYRKRLLP